MTSANDLNMTTERDGQQLFLERFQELLALQSDPRITLTNIYKEMPVTHPASITEIKGHHLELRTCELQLAAISQCQEVYILSPHLDAPIRGELDGMDIRRGVVQLHQFSFAELKQTNRKTVRVRFKRPVQIVLHSGPDKISGVIHDISLGGCCINTLVRRELSEPAQVQVELKLIDPGSGRLNYSSIPAEMVQVYGDPPPYRCALSFRHTQQTEQFLSVFIYQRQLEILKELRETL